MVSELNTKAAKEAKDRRFAPPFGPFVNFVFSF